MHGNRGLYYEELDTETTYHHQPGRTVTEFDNVLWTLLSMNLQPLHLDAQFAEETEFGERLVNSMFTLSTVVGLQVNDLTLGTTVANLGFEDVRFPHPMFVGDTLRAETDVVDKRRSESRDDAGVVTFKHRGKNHHDDLVCECTRVALMRYQEAHDD